MRGRHPKKRPERDKQTPTAATVAKISLSASGLCRKSPLSHDPQRMSPCVVEAQERFTNTTRAHTHRANIRSRLTRNRNKFDLDSSKVNLSLIVVHYCLMIGFLISAISSWLEKPSGHQRTNKSRTWAAPLDWNFLSTETSKHEWVIYIFEQSFVLS